jgi:hypothetical protein
MRFVSSVCLIGVLGWATVVQAASIQIKVDLDTNRTSSPNPDTPAAAGSPPYHTQSDFISWDVTNIGTSSTVNTIDGVGFQLFGMSAARNVRGRSVGSGGAYDKLTRDFVFNEGADNRGIGLRISGLDVGTYSMRSWHYDSTASVLASQNLMLVDVRNQGSSTILDTPVQDFLFSGSPVFFKFEVTAPGQVKELIFREDGAVPPPPDPIPASYYRARLNGFVLTSVPEPSSVCLAGLALSAFAISGVRRSRKK